MSNLLVVDWDHFFYNPLEQRSPNMSEVSLYDWGHGESPLFINGLVWSIRAVGFQRSGLELPGANERWRTFWERMRISPDATLHYADSNAYAGTLHADGGWDSVWLFDAHHDCYRYKSISDVREWAEDSAGEITCENWMFVHWWNGLTNLHRPQLHWRFPPTHDRYRSGAWRQEVPEFLGLDAAPDDDVRPDVEFDTVFLCRSGGWVPPWCDQDYLAFLRACPVDEDTSLDDSDPVREWDAQQVQAFAGQWINAE